MLKLDLKRAYQTLIQSKKYQIFNYFVKLLLKKLT